MTLLVLAGLLLTLAWWWLFERFPLAPALTRRALGQLLELLLYSDSPRVLGKVWLDLVASSWRLARTLLAPSLASLVVLLLVMQGLDGYCRYRPVQAGEPFLVSAPSAFPLEHAQGLKLDSAALQVTPALSYWRVVATHSGRPWLRVRQQSAAVEVGSGWPFLGGSTGPIRVFYPRREFWVGDRCLDWFWILGVSCLAWLALGLVFKCYWWLLVRQEGLGSSRKR